MLHLEVKLKQAKLDWRVFSLEFHRNGKNYLFKGTRQSGKFSQLFIESEDHALNEQARFSTVTQNTNFVWTLKYYK